MVSPIAKRRRLSGVTKACRERGPLRAGLASRGKEEDVGIGTVFPIHLFDQIQVGRTVAIEQREIVPMCVVSTGEGAPAGLSGKANRITTRIIHIQIAGALSRLKNFEFS